MGNGNSKVISVRHEPTAKEVRFLGKVFLAVSLLLGLLVARNFMTTGLWPWQVWISSSFGIVGLVCLVLGETAKPIYHAWESLGRLMGEVVSPLVMGVLFWGILTPFSMVYKFIRKGGIPLRPDSALSTYWLVPEQKRSSRQRLLRQY